MRNFERGDGRYGLGNCNAVNGAGRPPLMHYSCKGSSPKDNLEILADN